MKTFFIPSLFVLVATAAFADSGQPAVTPLVGGALMRDGIVYPSYSTIGAGLTYDTFKKAFVAPATDPTPLYVDGALAQGIQGDGVYYADGLPFNGLADDTKTYRDGLPLTGFSEYGVYYVDGGQFNGLAADGKTYLDGGLSQGCGYDGRYYTDGYPIQGIGGYDGRYYDNGNPADGFHDGLYYNYGSPYTGWVQVGDNYCNFGNGFMYEYYHPDGRLFWGDVPANGYGYGSWYVGGSVSSLDSNGFGFYDGNVYEYGNNRGPTGYDSAASVYYVNSTPTPLSSNGTGWWNGTYWYIGGDGLPYDTGSALDTEGYGEDGLDSNGNPRP